MPEHEYSAFFKSPSCVLPGARTVKAEVSIFHLSSFQGWLYFSEKTEIVE